MLRRRSILTATAAGLATTALPRFVLAQGRDGVTLHRGNGAEPETLDPHKSSGVPESYIQYDLFEGLTTLDPKANIIPGAAERWTANDDASVWTFHLRRNGKWSDGTPVTAHDWVFSWRRLLDPKTAADYAHYLWRVKNGEEVNFGKVPPEELGVRAVDDYTFEVTLASPTPYFYQTLHHHSSYALSKASVEAHGDGFIRPGTLVGNGAFLLAEAVPQGHVKVVKNPHYHGAADVGIDTIYFYPTENLEAELRRYRAGQLHVTYEVPVTQTDWVKANLADEYRVSVQFGTYFYGLNLTKEPWKSNKDLRLALLLAIDRQIICDKITRQGETPTFSWVPPGAASYTPQVPEWAQWTQEQRDTQARELMAKAGYGRGGKPLEVEILYNTQENHRKVAVAVASMWQTKLGVKTTLVNQEWKVFLETRDQKVFKDIVRHGWIGDYLDATSFLDLFLSDVGEINPCGYANPAYDKLLEAASRTTDGEKRRALLQEAERMLLDDVALIPLYIYASQHLVRSDVTGWEDNVLDMHPSRFIRLKA